MRRNDDGATGEATGRSGQGAWRQWVLRLRRRWLQWRGLEARTRVQIRCDRREYDGWWVCPQAIRRGDVVYSFSVAGDLAFERALAREYEARVFAFDPELESDAGSDAGEAGQAGDIRRLAIGIAGRDGQVRPAPDAHHADFQMLRLPSIMRMLGHRRLDLIKVEARDGEIDAVRDLVRMDVDVGQVLLAFRPDPTPAGRDRIEAVVKTLSDRGYRIFHISPDGRRYSFIRTEYAAP